MLQYNIEKHIKKTGKRSDEDCMLEEEADVLCCATGWGGVESPVNVNRTENLIIVYV